MHFASTADMRGHRLPLLFAILVLGVVVTIFVRPSLRLEERIAWLASQPSGTTAFQHPESGRSDALVALISVVVLTPIVAFVLVVALTLLVKVFQTPLGLLHLPAWLSAPVVGVVSILAMYATSQSWLPPSLSALGLVARAYLVFSYSNPPLYH